MKKGLAILLVFSLLFLMGCERYTRLVEIDGIIHTNDLSLKLRANNDSKHHYTLTKINNVDEAGGYSLKIDVEDEFSLRGEAELQPGRRYKLSFTMKNMGANPVVGYSFWKDSITMIRHDTLAGENGNPPVSKTQALYDDWTTFEETFETNEQEKSFMLTLLCGKGVFYIKDISIEEL